MQKFTVNTPDGKSYTVNAPAGSTHEDAINHVRKTYYNINTSMPKPNETMFDKVKNSPVGGVVRGARDIVDGGAQLITRGLEAVAPAGSDFEKYMQGERQKVEGINQQAEQEYKQDWRQGQDVGMDAGRIGGNIAASLPLAALAPGLAATTTAGRTAAGAGAGVIGASTQPVDVQKNPDYWKEKAIQMSLGGAFGAASPHIADFIGRGGSAITNKLKSALNINNQTINQTLKAELSGRGVDFDKLSKEVQESLAADAKKALSTTGTLNYDALARKADFEAAGIKPTLGQVTRDPAQYQFERNTSGIAGSGEDLATRFNEQNQQLISGLNRAREGTGGIGADKYAAGDDIIESLKNLDAGRKAEVSNLYNQARDAAGINTPLNSASFAQNVNNQLDDAMLGDALPGGVRKAINQIATGEMPFTIQKAEQIRQAINGQMSGIPDRSNVAMRIVNDTLQNEIDRVGSASGQQAGEAFKAARAAASKRFNQLDSSAPLKAAVDGKAAPDDFIKKYVVSGKAGDLMSLRGDLKENPQLWNEVRGQVIDWIKDRSLNSSADEYGKFSQSAYNKAVNQIGNAKLKILFNKGEIDQIKRLGRVASAIQVQPAGSVVNNSGTSQAITNLLNRTSKIPYLKELAVNPLQNWRTQSQINNALNASVPPGANLSPRQIRGLNLPLSVSGYPVLKPILE